MIHVFKGLETIGHTSESYNGAGGYFADGSDYFSDVGHCRVIGISQFAESKQGFGVTIGTVMVTSFTIEVKTGGVIAFIPFITSYSLVEGFKIGRIPVISIFFSNHIKEIKVIQYYAK